MRPLPYEQAMRVLLEGTCGANAAEIGRVTGLSRKTVGEFLSGVRASDAAVEAIGRFIWRRMNAHLLISDEDLRREE